MRKSDFETAKTRVQYRNGKWAELTEKQLAAVRKVSGIERLMPSLKTLGENPELEADVRLSKGGEA